ncbi:MAG: glutamyl-Q tRNA(Asp) synthetase [Candidatus Azotimanducaceae bacterium]|jgi:glutamyl-Q tRNA(Asp) synthetase
MNARNTYIGRFAPSPTGPLHFGSLVAALASYLDARSKNGQWRLRIEDLDPPRESSSAPDQIIEQLQHFGFKWDGNILFQSARLSTYQAGLERLESKKMCYPCTCSRKSFGQVYPHICRHRTSSTEPFATRLMVQDATICIDDNILGYQSWHVEEDIGDFIIKRKDGLFAYQLAVVIDDADQKITDIIRGSDLLDSTPKQNYLRQCLELPEIQHAHIPVILGDDGNKLSKQAHAAAVSRSDSTHVFLLALKALGQTRIEPNTTTFMMKQAIKNWRIENIPKIKSIAFRSL